MPPTRPVVFVLALLMLAVLEPVALADTPKPPGDSPKWCRTCHRDDRYSEVTMKGSVHADLACRDCHSGFQFNPHEEVEEPDEEALAGLEDGRAGNPTAVAACRSCHETAAEEIASSPHGKAFLDKKDKAAPYCLDCHGEPHAIPVSAKLPTLQRRRQMTERCAGCHADDKRAGGKSEHAADIVPTYDHSVHGRKLALGSSNAPGCVDCHGGHVLDRSKKGVAAACGKCHTGSTEAVVGAFTHTPEHKDPVAHLTKKFFAWLTFITIFLLAMHVLLDITAQIRNRGKAPAHAPAPKGEVVRFDVHQRLQHGLMALSFTMLVLTGWPLSAHKVGASSALMNLFGGVDRCALIHRIAGIGLIAASAYHVLYLIVLIARRRMTAAMLPAPQDVRDLMGNLAYFVGLRKDRPKFPRFSYFEKFDYWAVFWGVVIMGVSGLVLWFPGPVAALLPTWVFSIVRVAHADEAILAALAIFVWHFYNVHLRPAVFPMSWVFITGRMSLEELREEHGAEYDALMRERAAEPASASEPEAAAQTEPAPTGSREAPV